MLLFDSSLKTFGGQNEQNERVYKIFVYQNQSLQVQLKH